MSLTPRCLLLPLIVVGFVEGAHHVNRKPYFLSDEYLVKLMKEENLTWTPGRNFHPERTHGEINALVGRSATLQHARGIDLNNGQIYAKSRKDKLLPDKFDSREQWPFCAETINKIYDTGFCASHYAAAVLQSLSDRICIMTQGEQKNLNFSVNQVLSCCKVCGDGCNGGYPYQVWKYIEREGIASGGAYNSNQGCIPYSIQSPCKYKEKSHHCSVKKNPYPKCEKDPMQCTNKVYAKKETKPQKVILATRIANSDEYSQAWTTDFIKKEIQSNGPVTGSMRLYDDFFSYKSGLYKPSKHAKKLDDLTVRVIGWGKKENLEYWIAACTWGPAFGENGFVKIRMGSAHLQIDRRMNAAVPVVD